MTNNNQNIIVAHSQINSSMIWSNGLPDVRCPVFKRQCPWRLGASGHVEHRIIESENDLGWKGPLLNLQVVFRFCQAVLSWYCKPSNIPMRTDKKAVLAQSCAVELLRDILARTCLQQNQRFSSICPDFWSHWLSQRVNLSQYKLSTCFKTCMHSTSRQLLFVHISRRRRKKVPFSRNSSHFLFPACASNHCCIRS